MKQVKRYRRALRGLGGMTVWVHDVDQHAAEAGLSRQYLQDMVVVKLLDSGIRALGIGNVPEPPGNPWLNIFVNTVRCEGLYFYVITVRLDEIVRPERNRSAKTIGTTWETMERGVAPATKMRERIDKTLELLLDYFIYDYITENRS
jgi:hypothetical protein